MLEFLNFDPFRDRVIWLMVAFAIRQMDIHKQAFSQWGIN